MTFIFALILGFVLSHSIPFFDIRNVPNFTLLLYTMLAIGLYGAVHGIDLEEFKNHRMLIVRAVTFGVVIKSIISGCVIWLLFHTPYAFIFGIIVAQIDPISVAHLLDGKSDMFSKGARTILRAWSSFDDPMTVLLALYIYLPLVVSKNGNFTIQQYGTGVIENILFALALFLVAKFVAKNNTIKLLLLCVAFLIAIPQQLMLGIALTGLFLRPTISSLPRIVSVTFFIAALLLGSLLTISESTILLGIALGIVAFAGQGIVTPLVASKLNVTDKLFLAFSQYNGITSVILALIISQWIPQTVSVIAFAVLTINLLYYGTNYFLNRALTK